MLNDTSQLCTNRTHTVIFIILPNNENNCTYTVDFKWYFPITEPTVHIQCFSNDTSKLLNRPYIYSDFAQKTQTPRLFMKCISEDSFRISNHILHKDFNRWDL